MKDRYAVNEMAYPSSFNMKEFKKLRSFTQRAEYCDSRLKYIDEGSSRIVFEIDDEKVLKLAYNRKGLAQNRVEAETPREYGIFAEIYDRHPNCYWIEMEKADHAFISDFNNIYGGKNGLFSDFLQRWSWDVIGAPTLEDRVFYCWLQPYIFYAVMSRKNLGKGDPNHTAFEAFESLDEYKGSLFEGIKQYILDCPLSTSYGDLQRIASYGVVKRNGEKEIVLIDYGFNDDVKKKFYKKH